MKSVQVNLEGEEVKRTIVDDKADALQYAVNSTILHRMKVMNLEAVRSVNGKYYDLIKLPSGHYPAPKLRLWKRLPIPVQGIRHSSTFRCPRCGRVSFFKSTYGCFWCENYGHSMSVSVRRKIRRREYFRNLRKKLELLILPVLVLLGKAYYMTSIRTHSLDFRNKNCYLYRKM
jgi:hypothetical protein